MHCVIFLLYLRDKYNRFGPRLPKKILRWLSAVSGQQIVGFRCALPQPTRLPSNFPLTHLPKLAIIPLCHNSTSTQPQSSARLLRYVAAIRTTRHHARRRSQQPVRFPARHLRKTDQRHTRPAIPDARSKRQPYHHRWRCSQRNRTPLAYWEAKDMDDDLARAVIDKTRGRLPPQ